MRSISRESSVKIILNIIVIFKWQIIKYMKTTVREGVSLLLRRVSNVFFNKYLLALSIFVVWVTFFDKNAMVTQWSLSQTVDQLESEKEFITENIEKTELIRKDLTRNQEKYAREKFYMKKPGEQVFIIEK